MNPIREPLKIIEIDLEPGEEAGREAAHTERRAITDMIRSEKMSLPVHVACLALHAEGLPLSL
jgi:hypothetical protein